MLEREQHNNLPGQSSHLAVSHCSCRKSTQSPFHCAMLHMSISVLEWFHFCSSDLWICYADRLWMWLFLYISLCACVCVCTYVCVHKKDKEGHVAIIWQRWEELWQVASVSFIGHPSCVFWTTSLDCVKTHSININTVIILHKHTCKSHSAKEGEWTHFVQAVYSPCW